MRPLPWIFLLISVVQCIDLPSHFQRCVHSAPNFNECFRAAIEHGIRSLAKGDKQLEVLPIDPIHIPSATIKEGSGAVKVVQKYTDLKIYGVSAIKLSKVQSTHSKDHFKIIINATAPQYIFDADYDFNGNILVLPIVGKGKSKFVLQNVQSDWLFTGNYQIKNNEQYLSIKTFQVTLIPEKVTYAFENLFNGNKALSDQIHVVLNENWKEVFDDVKDGYEELIGTVAKSVSNSIFSKVPMNKIFL